MKEQNELITASMQIILHAGNARNDADEALTEAKKFHFDAAESFYKKPRNPLRWHINRRRASFKTKRADMDMNRLYYLLMRRIHL